MKHAWTKSLLAATALAATSLLALPAQAQETLRIADSFPVGHYIPENMTQVWMDRVTELTDGTIEFEYYPAEQLGKAKDLLSLTQTGVADIGYVGPSYVSDKLPLSAVAELPEAFTTSCEGTRAFWEIAKPGGVLDEVEFAPNNVRVLLVMVLPPYQVFTASKPIEDLDSLSGLKLRTTGGAKEIATTKIGAVPVQMAAPETRDALSRGTIDGVLFPHSSILPYDIHPQLKYGTQGMNFGSFVATYMISQERWDMLSEDVQQAFMQASEEAIEAGCTAADKLDAEDKQTIADSGVTFVDLPPEDVETIDGLMSEVSGEWATALDDRGLAGTEILEAFRSALQAGE